MRLISFDPFRGLGLAQQFVKPDHWLDHAALLRTADVLLFPETWQVNVLHHVLRKPLFPNLASYRLGYDKPEMTRALQWAAPDAVPPTLILPSTPSAAEQVLDTFGLPLVVKEPRNSMGRGVALVEDRAGLLRWMATHEVLYAQQYLPNLGDIRVVWVGRQVVAAYWRRNEQGFHNNIARGGRVDFSNVPFPAIELVDRTARALGLDHAGFDVMLVDGHPYLLEFNVLFGHDALNQAGIDIRPVILAYLEDLHGTGRRSPRAA